MNYKGYDSNTGKNATEVASHSFDIVDSFFNRLESLTKTKTAYDQVQNELKTKVADLDLHARYYGVGSVYQDPKTGQVKLDTQSASQWPVPPIVQAQIPYVMASAGATPAQIAQAMTSMNQRATPPGTPPPTGSALPAGAGIQMPAAGGGQPAFIQVPSMGSGQAGVYPAPSAPNASINNALQSALTNPAMTNAPPIQKRAMGARVVGQAINNAMVPATKAAEDIAKTVVESDKDFNTVGQLIGNAVSALKAAQIQQGGGGPMKGILGSFNAMLGRPNTGAITSYTEVRRSTALALAKQYSGGSRGAVTLFENLLASFPSNSSTSEQAGSMFAEMYLTSFALKKAVDELKAQGIDVTELDATTLAKQKIAQWSPEEQQAIYEAIGKKFKSIAPRKVVDLEGNVSDPKSGAEAPKFKEGDTRIVNGQLYTRGKDGKWKR